MCLAYLFKAAVTQLALEVVDSVEHGGILLKEVAEWLGEGLGLALCDLAEAAGLVLGEMPVDLADFAGCQLGDAACARAILAGCAAVHVGEDEVL